MKTIADFKTLNAKVQKVLKLNGTIYDGHFSQFDRALSLSKLVSEIITELKDSAWAIIREHEAANWKEYVSNLLGLSYSYISRLVQVSKLSPEHVSNYKDFCKANQLTPELLGLLNFGKDKKEPFKSELVITYAGKTSKVNKEGIFNTSLNEEEIKSLIAYLSKFIGK
jgi:hypothetical protein